MVITNAAFIHKVRSTRPNVHICVGNSTVVWEEGGGGGEGEEALGRGRRSEGEDRGRERGREGGRGKGGKGEGREGARVEGEGYLCYLRWLTCMATNQVYKLGNQLLHTNCSKNAFMYKRNVLQLSGW